MKKITGSIVALVTPFNHDGSTDFVRLRELVDWHIENKTDALLVLGLFHWVQILPLQVFNQRQLHDGFVVGLDDDDRNLF